MMNAPDFESDPDYSQFGLHLSNDDEGNLLVNAEKNDEFDPRIRDDVEGLLFLGRLTHDFDLYGHSFTIRTLTRGERLAAAQFVREYEDTLGIADALQTAYLALAIMLVDGRPLSIQLEDSRSQEIENRLRTNFAIVQRWYDPVIEAIYAEYSNLLVRQNIAFQELEGKSMASRRTPAP